MRATQSPVCLRSVARLGVRTATLWVLPLMPLRSRSSPGGLCIPGAGNCGSFIRRDERPRVRAVAAAV